MTTLQLAPPTPQSPPLLARVAVAGWSAMGVDLIHALERRGYAARTVFDLTHCEAPAFAQGCQAIVLVVRSGEEGRAVGLCRGLASRFQVGVVAVYLGADATFAIEALEAGADDCVGEPVNPHEVVARVRAGLRRRSKAPVARRRLGELEFDRTRLAVRTPGQCRLALTRTQFDLLDALTKRPGEIVSREQLIAASAGEDCENFDRSIDVQICRLRRRLLSIGLRDVIQTAPGAGYRLNPSIC